MPICVCQDPDGLHAGHCGLIRRAAHAVRSGTGTHSSVAIAICTLMRRHPGLAQDSSIQPTDRWSVRSTATTETRTGLP